MPKRTVNIHSLTQASGHYELCCYECPSRLKVKANAPFLALLQRALEDEQALEVDWDDDELLVRGAREL